MFHKGHQHSGNPTPSRNINAKADMFCPKRAMIKMHDVIESFVVSVAVCMEMSA